MVFSNSGNKGRRGIASANKYHATALVLLCLFATSSIARAQSPVEGLAVSVIENADERIGSRLSAVFELLGAAPSIHSVPGANFGEPGLLTSNDPNRPIPKFGGWVSTTGTYWERPDKGRTSGYDGHRYGVAAGVGLPFKGPWQGSVFVGADHSSVDYTNGENVSANAGFSGIEVRRQGDNGIMAGFSAVVGYSESEANQPVPLGPFTRAATADYDSYFTAFIGSVGKRVKVSDRNSIRFTGSAAYGGEWTEQYNFILGPRQFTIDETYTHVVDFQFEVALERVLDIGQGGAIEVFAGVLSHKVVGSDQTVGFAGRSFDIGDSESDSTGGFVGAGMTSRFGDHWRAAARAQIYYGSDETFATGGTLRLVGIF